MPYIGNTTSDFSIDTGNITNRAVTATKLSPSSVGSNGQVLSVDGSGNLQWSADASGTALTGSTDNTITTVTGANAIQGEANLTFNNSVLSIINTSNLGDAFLYIKAGEAGASVIELQADEADDNNDLWRIQNAGDSKLAFRSKESGSWIEKLGIAADGNTTFAGSLIISEDNAIHLKGATDSDKDSIVRESSGNALLINSRNDAIVNIDSNADSTDAHFAVAHGAATSGSTELFRVQENGRIGIGTSSPQRRFVIYEETSGQTQIQFQNSTTGAASGDGFSIGLDSSEKGFLWNYEGTDTYIGGAGGTSITIKDDKKVGIGTTSPDNLLHLYESSTTQTASTESQLVLEKNSDSGITILSGYTSNGRILFGDSGDNDIGQIDYNHNNNSLTFVTAASPAITIDSSQKVGIGTTSPDAPLTVHSSSDPEIRFGYNASQDHRIAWDSSKVYIHADPENANSNSALGLSVDGSTKLYITDAGKVGIGDTSPDCKLHVNAGAADDALKLESTDNAVNLILTDAACYSSIQQNNDMLNINSDPGSTVSASTIRFNIDGVNVGTFLNNQFRLGSNSAGIQFHGDTAAANSLDDYEEGTWTPNITFSTGGNTASYGSNTGGWYVKVGRLVTLNGRIQITAKGAGSSAVYFGGLPFTVGNHNSGTSGVEGGLTLSYLANVNADKGSGIIGGYASENTTQAIPFYVDTSNNFHYVEDFDLESDASIGFILTYCV